jgi:PAS domain S-box-containing protein
VQTLLILLVCGSAALAWRVLRRPDAGPAAYWVAGWLSAGAGGMLLVLHREFPLAHFLAYPLGTLFATLLLAGSLVRATRPVPPWLLPGGLAFGLLRAGLVAAGHETASWGAALAVEPAAVLTGAVIVHRAILRGPATRAERLLGPSLAVLAAIGALHVAWIMLAGGFPPNLLAAWVMAIPPLLGIQLYAESERERKALKRARDDLEARVAARTAELARVNASLRLEIAVRRATEAALRESEARYRVVSELGSDLAFGFTVGFDDRVSGGWITDAYTRITGYSLSELQGSGWLPLVPPDDLARIRENFEEILAQRSRELEVRLTTKQGREIRVQARVRVTRDDAGQCFHVVGAARDVTDERHAEEERRRLERHVLEAQRLESLAMLTGGVAHDFNNLLAVILGNSRMALAEAPPASPQRTRLTRIRAAAEHGARLTEQMLAYSGKSSLALKPIDLSQLVDEMTDLLRASISDRCRLELDLGPRAPVEGDATQLQQVVLNLVTNASESFAGRQGTVRVRTGCSQEDAATLAGATGTDDPAPGPYAFLEVSDDGPGMDAATRARIFEPFFTTKFSGRGLGLAAVLGIVRAHRGVLEVRSAPGEGSTLRVLLPEARSAVSQTAAADAAETGTLRRGTVLVVDDQDSVVEIAQIILEAAGHRVLTAVGGRAGIEAFRSRAHEIDAVLLDLAMPDTGGEEVLREMQRVRPDVRVIISTGYGDDRVRASGVIGYVRKPYEPEEILEEIDRALARDPES